MDWPAFTLPKRGITIAAALALAVNAPWHVAISGFPGVAGGTLKISDSISVAVPDSFVVTATRYSGGSVFVIAGNERVDESGRRHFLSELWLFPTRSKKDSILTFADRTVLLSFASRQGEGQQLITSLVRGPHAMAVQINGWESERFVVFDKKGTLKEPSLDAIATACDCWPAYTTPVTWLALDDERRDDWYLLCSVGEEGGKGPFVMLYKFSDGTVQVLSTERALGELGDSMLRHFSSY